LSHKKIRRDAHIPLDNFFTVLYIFVNKAVCAKVFINTGKNGYGFG